MHFTIKDCRLLEMKSEKIMPTNQLLGPRILKETKINMLKRVKNMTILLIKKNMLQKLIKKYLKKRTISIMNNL